jgi:NAD+ synthase
MTTLYYFAGIHGLLVTGTGNKVEDFEVVFIQNMEMEELT